MRSLILQRKGGTNPVADEENERAGMTCFLISLADPLEWPESAALTNCGQQSEPTPLPTLGRQSFGAKFDHE